MFLIPNQKGRAKPQRRKNGGRGGAGGTSQPMPLRSSIQVDKVVRYKFASALSNVEITDQDLLNLIVVATTTTATTELASAVKLRKIEMWADPVAGGSLISIEDIAQVAGVGGPSRIKEDVTLGVARPAHLTWTPAPGSLQAMWIASHAGTEYLALNSSGAGYLDLHVSWVLQDGENPSSGGAVSGATAGALYLRALDNQGASALVPVSYATI